MGERSAGYRRAEEHVLAEYTSRNTDERSQHWLRTIAPLWRSRVGLPRLVAEAVLFEALSSVRSLNRGLFRHSPEERRLYDQALAALEELAMALSRENWRRFNTRPREKRAPAEDRSDSEE